ncbi:MAG: DUF3786 domain-containing protein [Desulfohalobiaceae bacterium]
MQIPQNIVLGGLDKAWSRLPNLDPEDVCRRSGAAYDPNQQVYTLTSLGQQIRIHPAQRNISSDSGLGRYLVQDLAELFWLSAVWYLLQAKDAQRTQRLLKPQDLPGGDIFAKGSHVLPLDELASRYGTQPEALLKTGQLLASQPQDFGDAALQLWPFPRLPLVIVLWAQDEEFPAKASLLLDSSAELHQPVDTLWATAMFSLQLLFKAAQHDTH